MSTGRSTKLGHSDATTPNTAGAATRPALEPGKRTLVEDQSAAVQRVEAAAGRPPLDDASVHRAAVQGVAGTGGALPHLEQIQRAFGPDHDLSRIDAHVGGAAATSAAQIGARAYATGNSVAFQQAPDLHTAAHEAAHVVQQQRGVQLKGGVGEAGDEYERHANAVADRVVRGESAAELLAPGGGAVAAGSTMAGVQREPEASTPNTDASAGGGAAAGGAAALTPIRQNARALLDGIPNRPITSTGDHDLFISLTGTSQETMAANWATGGIMTACNGFTGTYGAKLGLSGMGTFNLSSAAAGAFVRPGNGRFPKDGDIVKMATLHVCVTVHCDGEGGSWQVVEAGQGGPKMGCDVLKHNSKTFSPSNVEGWVDLDLWADPSVRARASSASKLIGTWEVKVGWRVWHYTFAPTGNAVSYVDAQNPDEHGSGTWDKDADGKNIALTWDSSTEAWPMAGVQHGSGSGTVSSVPEGSSFKKLH